MDDDGLHDVQFELTRFGGHRDGQVVADNAESHLVHDFRNDGIHLARHDGRTRLAGRQVDFVQTAAGAGREQTQVVAYLGELHGETFQRRGVHDECTGVVRRLYHVRCDHHRQARDFTQILFADGRIVRVGIDTRTDCGGTHVHLIEELVVLFQPLHLFGEVRCIGFELLPECHRYGVLQLRASHLDDVGELYALGTESLHELFEGVLQLGDAADEGYLHGRGVGVVGGLRQIDVVIGVAVFVFALLVAHQFEGDVGDDLVGVHVGGGAGSALYHVHNELVVELAVAYHAACLYDGVGSLFVEQSQVAVRQCGGFFHVGQGLDDFREKAEPYAADMEILHTAHRLHAEVILFRNLHVTYQVVFFSCFARQLGSRDIHSLNEVNLKNLCLVLICLAVGLVIPQFCKCSYFYV